MVTQLPTVAGRVPEKLLPLYLALKNQGYTDSEIAREGIRALYRQVNITLHEVTA